jgi:hypothetical protein
MPTMIRTLAGIENTLMSADDPTERVSQVLRLLRRVVPYEQSGHPGSTISGPQWWSRFLLEALLSSFTIGPTGSGKRTPARG